MKPDTELFKPFKNSAPPVSLANPEINRLIDSAVMPKHVQGEEKKKKEGSTGQNKIENQGMAKRAMFSSRSNTVEQNS